MLARTAVLLSIVALPGAAIGQLDWRRGAHLTSRWAHAVGFDPARDQAVLFGGQADRTVHGDTWIWSGSEWTEATPATVPPPRESHAIAYDSARGRLLMFGGAGDRGAPREDLWEWNGSDWTEIVTATRPRTNGTVLMVYDPGRDRLVAMSWSGSSSFNSVWEFDGTAWTEHADTGGVWPTPDWRWKMIYDPRSRRTLLFEKPFGAPGTIWSWDGTGWNTTSSPTMPESAVTGALVWDGTNILAAGGQGGNSLYIRDLWAFDGTAWSLVSPNGPEFAQHQAFFDAARSRSVWVGSYDENAVANSATFSFDGANWAELATAAPPAERRPLLAWDGSRDRLYSFGSSIRGSGATWRRDATGWHIIHRETDVVAGGSSRPLTGIDGPDLVFDAARGQLLLIGSAFQDSAWRYGSLGWQPWTWNSGPPDLEAAAIAYDSVRERVVVFGGLRKQSEPRGVTDATWEWNGTSWTQVQTAQRPSARRDARMAYDPDRQRMVLFGGGLNGWLDDTWEYDGSNWVDVTSANAPPPSGQHGMAFDPVRRRVCLVTWRDDLTQLWEWTGQDWLRRATPTTVPLSSAADLVATASDVMFLGGVLDEDTMDDIWHLASAQPGAVSVDGTGCATANSLPLELRGGTARPWLGESFEVSLAPLPASFLALPGLWIGFARDQWQGMPIPVDLGAFGFPGCEVLIRGESPWPVAHAGTGLGTASLSIPANPQFLGLDFYLQGLVFDAGSVQLATSNALSCTIGIR